jgi:hypothetical protein
MSIRRRLATDAEAFTSCYDAIGGGGHEVSNEPVVVGVVEIENRRWLEHNRTTEDYIAAIRAAKGMLTIAARMLGVSQQCVYQQVKRHPELEAARVEARESTTDFAELKLYDAIANGEAWAINLYLKTQGKNRGYVERVEHSNAGDDSFKVEVVARDYRTALNAFLPPAEDDG